MLDRRSIICGTRRRRGEIYLEDDEISAAKKPFYLQPAPKTRYKISLNEKELDSDTDFAYDSDAYEKV